MHGQQNIKKYALLLEISNRVLSKHDPCYELQRGMYCCCEPRGHWWIVWVDTFTFSELQNNYLLVFLTLWMCR